MSLFKFIGGLIGGNAAKKASKKATAAMVDALNRGIDEQGRQYDLSRQDFGPYRDTGVAALGGLGDLTGIHGPEKWQAALDALKQSPFYQSLYRTGEEAVLQNAAATGGIRGGNTQRGLADFGADTLMQAIERQLASLGGLAGMGLGSTEAVANLGRHKADAVSNLLSNIGQTRASGYLARGGINNQMWNNAGSFLDKAVAAFMPGGGGMGSIFKGGF